MTIKMTINAFNTVALNHEEIGKNYLLSKYNWKGINNPSKKMIGKSVRKIIKGLLLMFCVLKKKKYILLTFQNIT